jgi:hypothetical protein
MNAASGISLELRGLPIELSRIALAPDAFLRPLVALHHVGDWVHLDVDNAAGHSPHAVHPPHAEVERILTRINNHDLRLAEKRHHSPQVLPHERSQSGAEIGRGPLMIEGVELRGRCLLQTVPRNRRRLHFSVGFRVRVDTPDRHSSRAAAGQGDGSAANQGAESRVDEPHAGQFSARSGRAPRVAFSPRSLAYGR